MYSLFKFMQDLVCIDVYLYHQGVLQRSRLCNFVNPYHKGISFYYVQL